VEPHANLLSGVQALLHLVRFRVPLAHIKGHQDSHFPTVLKCDESLNVEVDLLPNTNWNNIPLALSTTISPLAAESVIVEKMNC